MGRRIFRVTPVFVETVPSTLEMGKLYVSPRFRTVTHTCACGCGAEIQTPLHPTGWKLTFDGVNLSLSPSVGNWSEKCQSHYWIEGNRVIWARKWTRTEIDLERRQRAADIAEYHGGGRADAGHWWQRLRRRFRK